MKPKTESERSEFVREKVLCNICNSDEARLQFSIQGFDIVRCSRCGLLYVNPRLTPKAIEELYSFAYYKSEDPVAYGYDDYLGEHNTIIKTFERRWKVMNPFLPKTGLMLDIGAACGFLLEVAKANGWHARGLEISEDMANYGRAQFGHDIIIGNLSEVDFKEGSFDLITIWDTIEHSRNPTEDIGVISRLLKPGGFLSLITPDSGSLHAQLAGGKWVEYLRPQEHIYFFSFKILKAMLDKVGFDVKLRTTVGKFVSWHFALNRLSCYWPKIIAVITVFMKMVGLYHDICYIDPKDKMFVIAQKRAL